ncbi:MAG: acyl-CoA dehydrogenase family protein [Pseudorhodoferax sp.]
MGQRATSSGRLVVQDTVVAPQWVLGDAATRPRAQIFAPLFQLGFASIFVGIAEAALAFAVEHVNTRLKPTAGYATAAHEPNLQGHIGHLRIQVSAAAALVRQAAEQMDGIERGEGAIHEVLSSVYQAKVFASHVALEASSRLFQIGGARLASRAWAADRFWRNARTLTLHDSVDKQTGIVGRHVLGIENPAVSNR